MPRRKLDGVGLGHVPALDPDRRRRSGSTSRLIMFKVVVLPEPEGPISTRNSPCRHTSG